MEGKSDKQHGTVLVIKERLAVVAIDEAHCVSEW